MTWQHISEPVARIVAKVKQARDKHLNSPVNCKECGDNEPGTLPASAPDDKMRP